MPEGFFPMISKKGRLGVHQSFEEWLGFLGAVGLGLWREFLDTAAGVA